MKITPLKIAGVYQIEMEPFRDERGSFARQFCRRELDAFGIGFDVKQCNLSVNRRAGTLRGMHYQKNPYSEIKVVSCFKGRCFDVVADIRPDSPTYLQWSGMELSADNYKMMYVPPGVAHGFQTLEDDTVVYYQLGEFFMPECYDGVRWNDPKLGIVWPECESRIMNERDMNYALL